MLKKCQPPDLQSLEEEAILAPMRQPSGRRERKKQQTRQHIASVALRLFLERGFDQVTVTEVADIADVSANTVYNYFPTKEELFFGLHRPMETELAKRIQQRQQGQTLLAFLREDLRFSLERLRAMPVEEGTERRQVIQMIQSTPSLQAYSLRMMQMGEREVERVLAEEMHAPEIVPHLVAHLILALYGKLFTEYDARCESGQSADEIHAALAEMISAGLELLAHGLDASYAP